MILRQYNTLKFIPIKYILREDAVTVVRFQFWIISLRCVAFKVFNQIYEINEN